MNSGLTAMNSQTSMEQLSICDSAKTAVALSTSKLCENTRKFARKFSCKRGRFSISQSTGKQLMRPAKVCRKTPTPSVKDRDSNN